MSQCESEGEQPTNLDKICWLNPGIWSRSDQMRNSPPLPRARSSLGRITLNCHLSRVATVETWVWRNSFLLTFFIKNRRNIRWEYIKVISPTWSFPGVIIRCTLWLYIACNEHYITITVQCKSKSYWNILTLLIKSSAPARCLFLTGLWFTNLESSRQI